MYTRIVFETAKEFFDACRDIRAKDDKFPFVPSSVYVVFDGDAPPFLSGDGSEKFELGGKITQSEMIETAFTMLRSTIHLT